MELHAAIIAASDIITPTRFVRIGVYHQYIYHVKYDEPRHIEYAYYAETLCHTGCRPGQVYYAYYENIDAITPPPLPPIYYASRSIGLRHTIIRYRRTYGEGG